MAEEIVEQTYVIPAWIDEPYLITILEKHEGKSIALHQHDIQHATGKGENYVGALFRVSIKYSIENSNDNKEISIIMKTRLEDDLVNEILDEFNVFQRESQVYKHIIDECTKLLHQINDTTIFGPKAIYVDERSIVLEDLAVKAYKIKDSKKKLNLDECKMVLEKVAKYHSSTAFLNSKKPELFKYHMQSNISEKFTPLHLVYQNTIKNCIKYANSVPELQQYVSKIDAYKDVIIEKLTKIFKRDENGFHVLNHGDLWVNNLMFSHDSAGIASDVLLVDYQEGYFGSPGIDLNWFIYTSCNQDVISNHLDELLHFYHSQLVSVLKGLSYDKPLPTFEDILGEIQNKGDHGLITLLCMTPLLIIENKEYADAKNIIDDSEDCEKIRDIIFNNGEYGKILINNLPTFITSGHL